MFLFVILSGIAGNLLEIRLLFPTSAECASLVSKASFSESCIFSVRYSFTSSFLCWPYGSAMLSMSGLNLRNVLSTMVANGSTRDFDLILILILIYPISYPGF